MFYLALVLLGIFIGIRFGQIQPSDEKSMIIALLLLLLILGGFLTSEAASGLDTKLLINRTVEVAGFSLLGLIFGTLLRFWGDFPNKP